jgi:conjugal transfer/entry exclusion protein
MSLSESDHQKTLAALQAIQDAQYLLDLAAQKLCSINGLFGQYGAVCKLSDTVKASWHELNDARARAWLSVPRSARLAERNAARIGGGQ